jgi:hypothetical protein
LWLKEQQNRYVGNHSWLVFSGKREPGGVIYSSESPSLDGPPLPLDLPPENDTK